MFQKNNLIYLLVFFMFLTSSFDIFLNINILSFNFRISQLIAIPLIILSFFKLKNTKIVKINGYISFLGWFLFLILSSFNTPLINMNIAYMLWLIFNFLIVFMFSNLFRSEDELKKVYRLYLYSFVCMAIFGIIQFIMPFFGMKNLFIRQWWIPNVLPRVNGFSYEPSYYATYMLIGWINFRILLKQGKEVIKGDKKIIIGFLIICVAMLLSSSRMGILFMLLFEILNFIYNFILNCSNKVRFRDVRKKNFRIIFIIIFLITLIFFINKYVYDLKFLLQGTGLANTSNHSFRIRFSGMIDTFNAFNKSPFIGYGLGGVYTAVAELNGYDIYANSVQDVANVLNVFIEVLAASGIFGFLFFMGYVLNITVKPLKFALKKLTFSNKHILMALSVSLLFEFLILIFNQNILRMYLWLNIAMVSLAYSIYKGRDTYE